MNQSPINISSLEAINDDSLGRLRTNYSRNQPFLASLGPFNVALNFGPDAGGIMVNSTEYILNQYHTHIPSEHILNGTRFPLEIHLVHRTSDGSRIAVISLPYTYGKRDHIFEQVLDMISSLKEKGGTLGSSLNMTDLKISGKAYYRYSGSLTTPPCTEGVVWTVLKEPRTISPEQLSRYQIAFTENNARFTQELNGRPILYHG
ncbi:hypothetical protein O6H91_19G026800 [Diphasiastrum complanatum]|nr:hypothetical protein O6H91_19G026800 [Diphasiastrum complanatum]